MTCNNYILFFVAITGRKETIFMYRLGIDIGSKTIKLAILDEHGKMIISEYKQHRSKIKENLQDLLHSFVWRYGDKEVQVTVTGSAGMRVAELFDVPFVQEVVALKEAVKTLLPGTDVILEMGGEDTKLVYLTGKPEQRMNTMCAGGTGGFIERMASMMGKRASDMNMLAMGANVIYPIASRCAVFAQSDVRPLLNAGARKEDVAASVLQAVCTQAVAGLSCGRPIRGKVALLGGPFEYTPALKFAFCKVTGISQENAIIPKDAHLFVVQGAAFSKMKSEPMMISSLEKRVKETSFIAQDSLTTLPPLFRDKKEYEQFVARHKTQRVPRTHLVDAHNNLFLGIDAGSTTMKITLIDDTGAICFYDYAWNQGDITVSLKKMLNEMFRNLGGTWIKNKVIRRCCIIGYGEQFCRAAYGIDMGEVETVAHLRAAKAFDPQVDFLLDIGGQDIKCFYIEDGNIIDIVLNEACSSGCGSLFDSVARSMRRTKEAMAIKALYAKHPVDLGTRCSVFMDSRVKHAQKEGVSQADIAAGVCYATARNALFKVVRQPDFTKVGSHVVVQGGAFANDALLRAFEIETGVEVMRPDLSKVMGAWGAALLARDWWLSLYDKDRQAALKIETTLIKPEHLKTLRIRRTAATCGQCTNNCQLQITRLFESRDDKVGRSFVLGNKCERGAASANVDHEVIKRPPNMLKIKQALLGKYDKQQQFDSKIKIGIPRVLSLYESYPFWKTFFNALQLDVVADVESDEDIYRSGMECIPSEGACYPSKLLFGHVAYLHEHGANLFFVPRSTSETMRDGLLGIDCGETSQECPLVERMPQMLKSNMHETVLDGIEILSANITMADNLDSIAQKMCEALDAFGLHYELEEVLHAAQIAREEYKSFFAKLSEHNNKIIARIDAGEFPGVLLNQHSYHNDPGINHGVDELLGELGYAVIERIDYDFEKRKPVENFPWSYERDSFYEQRTSAKHPNMQFVNLRSFGCGIDALAADTLHDELRADSRIFAELKLDQIVDVAAIRIRLRSLAYANKQDKGDVTIHEVEWKEEKEAVL